MNIGSHFRLFSEAATYMDRLRTATHVHAPLREARFISEMIDQGQRFYLPGNLELFGESQLSSKLALPLPQLPFDAITIMSEVPARWEDKGAYRYHPCITCAMRNESPTHPHIAMFVCSALKVDASPWMPSPLVLIHHSTSEAAQDVSCDGTPYAQFLMDRGFEYQSEMLVDFGRIANLCKLLELRNVHATRIDPPDKLNRKRERNGKRPLYSYHVLDVAGEQWAAPHNVGNGTGVRSHLRRGHIRRLSDHSVWVRETFVHGSVPGFVDKDYNTAPLAASARST